MFKFLQRMLLLAALAVPWATQAQTLEEYYVAVDTTTFTSIVSTGTALSFSTQDDGYATVTLPFALPYGESNLAAGSTIACSANGFLYLGATSTSGTTGVYSSATYRAVNALMQQDAHIGRYSESGAYWEYDSTSAVRSLTIEYHGLGTYSEAYGFYSYQVIFFEDGNIEFVYDSMYTGTTTTRTLATYLTDGPNGDRLFLTGPWATPTVSNTYATRPNTPVPAHGLRYTFSRPVINCARPRMIDALATANDMTVFWSHGGTETSWELLFDGVSYFPTDTFYTVTNLAPNTLHTAAIRAICGADDSSAWKMGSFRTECGMITSMPFSEDFEDCPYYLSGTWTYAEALPYCWDRINDATGSYDYYPYVSTTSSYLINGSKSLYWYHTTTASYADNQYIVLPPVDLSVYDISDLTLGFYAKTTATAAPWPLFIVGVMDSLDETTFVPLDTITLTSTAEFYVVSLAGYTGTGNRIAIRSPRTTSTRYCSLDDVFLTDEWCDLPANAHVAAATDQAITLAWESNGNTMFTVVLGEDTVNNVTDTFYTFSGLTADSLYTYAVMTQCSNSFSMPLEGTARTQCAMLSVLPYSEGFEDAASGTAAEFPSCWHRINDATGTYTYYPYVTTTATYAHSGTKGMYWYHSTTAGYAMNEYAVLPPIDTTVYNISDLTMSFYAKTTATASPWPQFIVGVMTNNLDASTFTPFDTVSLTSDWELYSFNFSDYNGYGNCIAIRCPRPTTSRYCALDDVFLTDEWCDEPQNVTASASSDEVTLSWEPNGGSSFEVVLGTDTVSGVTDTFYVFQNLNANTLYGYSVATECSNGNSLYINGTVRTLCGALDSLPYTQTFESAPTGGSTSTTFVECMYRLNNGTSYFGYPYVSATASYNHTANGTKGLYWYNSTTTGTYGDYQIVVLPGVDTNNYPINTLQLRFWARATSTSYNPTFEVGVMTNPYDASTFQTVSTVNVGGNTTYSEFVTTLGNFTGEGQFVAIRALRPTTLWYATVDDITLEEMPSCPDINNLDVASVTPGAAMLTWNYMSGTADVPTGYDIEYVEVGSGDNPTSASATDNYYMLTGLDASTSYKFYVRSDCGGNYGTWDSIAFSTSGLGCIEIDTTQNDSIVLAGGTNTSYYIPIGNYYNYSYTQQLVLASEMNGAGSITGIDFQYAGSSASTSKNNVTIYLANTSATSLTSAFVPYDASFVAVYTGNLNGTPGWNHYEFTTPFNYDGSSNLLIVIHDNSGGYNGTAYTFSTHSATGKARYVQNDSSPYTISSIGSTSGSSYSYRANMKLYTTGCSQYATCAAPAVTVTNATSDQVDIAWIPGYQETSWDVEYRTANGTWQTEATGTSANTYSFTNLTPATNYEFRVSHTCDTTTYAGTVQFTTPCVAMPVPFSYGFEDFPLSGVTTGMPNCWTRHSTYGAAYPYGSSSYFHSGSRALYHYSTSSTYSYLVLPTFEAAIDSLQVSFWMLKSNTSYTHAVQVGVMTDPNDFSTFQSVATVQCTNLSTWELKEVNLDSYTGNGQYIALLSPNGVYCYPYIDDIMVDYIPTCPHVTNLHTTAVSADSAYLAWTAGSTETEWIVSDGINEFSTNVNSIGLGNLFPNTVYTMTVRPVCSDSDTGYAMEIVVRTECPEYMILPYSNDFESDPHYSAVTYVNAFPSCWDRINDASGTYNYYPYLYATTSYAHSGTTGMYWYQSTTTTYANNEYAVLPPVDTLQNPVNMLSMSFYVKTTSTSYHPQPIVGVMTGTDTSTFDTVYAFNATEITTTWQQKTISFENYTGTGNRIAIKWPRPGSASYMAIDDIEVWRNSSCATPSYVAVNSIYNDNATVNWGDTVGYPSVTVLWGRVNNIAAAEDSMVVSGATSTVINNLIGNTTYYVWVRGECTEEPSRTVQTSFTTTPDCVPVENLSVAGTDYTAFGLNWDAPSAGHAATAYIVSWRESGTVTWNSDTTNNTYYYIGGLSLNTPYQYAVTTICNNEVSAANSGTVSTMGCGRSVTEGGTNFAYLPTQQYYNYSYTQQIYTSEELAGIDSIANIAFQVVDGYEASTRNVTVYMANTSKSSFASTADFIPESALTQVYTGTLGGSGWINLHLTNVFARNVDSNLVVVVDDNTGSYTSTIYWGATTTSSARAIYFYQDGSNILPSAPSADNSGVVYYVNQILVSGSTCTTPNCGAPIVFATNVGTNNIDITWNVETGATYEIAYRQEGTANWTIFQTGNTTGTCSITGLTPSADWNIRVRFDCNGDTLVGTRTVATLCGPAALPLTENFQSREYGRFERSCWITGTTNLGTASPYPYVISLSGAEDNKLCRFYNGGYMILPKVDAPLNELQIRFKFTQGGDNVRFLMGTISDPTLPISAMHVLDTLIRSDIDTTTNTVNITYSFANIDLADTGSHICFWDAFNDNYSFLDDIVVEYIPLCTPASDFTVTTTTNSADISWTNDGQNGTSYIIEYGPRYFTLGTGTQITTTSSPVTINGLSHSTSYDAYVYTVCGATGDTSIESQVIMFQTSCDVITTLPYFTDFENIMSPGSSATDVLPNCWAAESSSGTMPHIYYTSTANYTTSPTHCFYYYSLGVAALPQFGVPLDTLMVSFDDYNSAPGGYGLIIGTVDSITPGFGASFQPIDTVVFENGVSNRYHVTSYLTEYTGNGSYIAIKSYNTNASSTYAYHYIDDLTVDYVPACIAPQHVHATLLLDNQADLAWTISNASSYTVEYGLHGFTPGTGTVVTTNTRSVSITGLTAQTQYDAYLVSGCGSDTTFYTFTTTCAPVTLPYSENFDALTTGTATSNLTVRPQCWDYIMTGSSTYQGASYLPGVYYSSTYAHSGSYSYRLYGVGYFMLPPMPTTLDSLQITFWDYTTSANYGLEVGVMEGSNFIPVQVINSPASTHVDYEIDFSSYTGTSRIIAFRNYYTTSSTTYYSYHYLDNIVVDYIPSCPKVLDVHSGAAGVTSIEVDWTDRVTAPEWEIQYGPVGFTLGGTNATSVIVTSHPYTVTGLDTLTMYDFYVRPICSSTDTGQWSGVAQLSTGVCDNQTTVNSWDNGAAASTTSYSPIGYSFYNYGYVQTIIDSAKLAASNGEFSAFAFKPTVTTAGHQYNNMTVYLANVPETDLSAAWILPDDSIHQFVKVIDNESFSYTSTGWKIHGFDTTFTWDGHSSILISVVRNNGSYTSGATFAAHNTSVAKTRYAYRDGSAYTYTAPDVTGTATTTMGDIQLISCGGPSCQVPALLPATDVTYQSATVNWNSNAATDFEVAVKAANDPSWPAEVSVSNATSYAVTNLTPATNYQFRVRAICDATEGLISEWAEGTFVTDSLPCFDPSNLQATATGYTTATLAWDADASQNLWEVHVWNSSFDTNYSATGNPFTVTGLAAKTGYSAAVKAICGGGYTESEYSNTIQFTTDSCAKVTGVTVSGTTTNSATVSWTSTGASKYVVEYGDYHFNTGDGTSVTVENATSYTITGLRANYDYSVAVKAVCEEGVEGNWSAPVDFTTNSEEEGVNTVDGGMSLAIYPNPTSDATTIALSGVNGEVSITIVDMNGRTVKTDTMSCEGDCTKRLEVSGLAQGAYFVRVSGEGVNQVKKLVVK